jgi:hypothetical protein
MPGRRPDYVRVWADADGESHFEDVVLESHERISPESGSQTVVSTVPGLHALTFRLVVREASSTEPHNAPERLFIINLVGEVEVAVSDGEVRGFGPGDVTLVEDTHGKGHVTRSLTRGERVTLVARAAAEEHSESHDDFAEDIAGLDPSHRRR